MYVAGLLHDVVKEKSDEEILDLCSKIEKHIPSSSKANPHSLHGIAGACFAYDEYNIKDEGILLAIAFHFGRATMSDNEKIVFLADFTDNSRKYGIDVTPVWKQNSLNSAMLTMCTLMVTYCVEHNVTMDERTKDSFDYMLEQVCEKKKEDKKEKEIIKNNVDTIVDGAMESYIAHRIKLKTVNNIRDFGGLNTIYNRKVKKGKLIRSAALSKMSKEDASYLKQIGIDTIIDLRSKEEIKKIPISILKGLNTIIVQFLQYMSMTIKKDLKNT